MTSEPIHELPQLIGDLFRVVDKLNSLFPDRSFTPDGHLVGSIGEVVAAYVYDLRLEPCSNEGFDARTKGASSQTVEVKLTGTRTIAVSSDYTASAEILLVMHLDRTTGFREVYNGPFPVDLCKALTPTKRQVIQIGLKRLEKLSPEKKALCSIEGRSLEDLNRSFPNPVGKQSGARVERS